MTAIEQPSCHRTFHEKLDAPELLLVSRNLERMADLATNAAEHAVDLAEGRTIKLHVEDRPAALRASRA